MKQSGPESRVLKTNPEKSASHRHSHFSCQSSLTVAFSKQNKGRPGHRGQETPPHAWVRCARNLEYMHWEGGREIYFHTAHASTAQYPPLCTELSLGRAEEAFQLDFAGNWRVVLRLLPLLHGALLGRRGSCLLPAAISLLLRRGVARHLRWRSRVNSEISTRWDMQTWDSHSSRLLTFVTLALLPIELDSVHAAVQKAREDRERTATITARGDRSRLSFGSGDVSES